MLRKRKSIAVICNNFEIDQPSGYNTAMQLYETLADKYDIRIIVPLDADIYTYYSHQVNSHMSIKPIYPSFEFSELIYKKSYDGYMKFQLHAHEDKIICEQLVSAVDDADIIICNALYFVYFVRKVFPNKVIVFRELDVEYDKICQKHINTPLVQNETLEMRKQKEKSIYQLESEACSCSDYMLSLSDEDEKRFRELYQLEQSKIIRMPICFKDASLYENFTPVLRTQEKIDCLFISYLFFDPERIAKRIVEIAPRLQNVCFHIVGAVGNALDRDSLPANVIVYGVVDDEKKREIFSKCNCALNLPSATSGINVKMMEYFSHGIPVLTNENGTRGYSIKPYEEYIPAAFETLESDIRAFSEMSIPDRHKIAINAFNYVCQQHKYENYIPLFEEQLGLNDDEITDEPDRENGGVNCYIFGAGEAGRKCRGELQKRGITCLGFSDNNSLTHGNTKYGLLIYSPNYVFDAVLHDKTLRLVIAVDTPVYLRQMYSQTAETLPQDKIDIFYHNELNPSNIDIEKLRKYC